MKARIEVDHESWGRVTTMLRNLGPKVDSNAARAMRRAAVRIQERAQNYTPVDEGDLEASIRIVEKRGKRGRLEIDIVMGGDQHHVTKANGQSVNLDSYALLVHEAYSTMKPGPNTIAKRTIYGEDKVGEKFMDRAFADDDGAAYHDVLEAVQEIINREGGGSKGSTITRTSKKGIVE